MKESDLIALYITFPDNKGRLTANGVDRKEIIDLPEEALSQIKEIILKSQTNSNNPGGDSGNGQDKGNNGKEDKSNQDKGNQDKTNQK